MRTEQLNWMGVEQYLKKDDRLMLVVGACEQHGYLSLLTDVKIPLALADAASEKSGVLVAPPVNFGCSPYFLTYPGTISLRLTTLLSVVEDILRSVHQQGFRRILVLNGHGGNAPVYGLLNELANEIPDLQMRFYVWWTSPAVGAVADKYGLEPNHANWLEAFPFTRVAALPAGKKTPLPKSAVLSASRTRQMLGDGVFGGDYQADDKIMDELFSANLQEVLQCLQFAE